MTYCEHLKEAIDGAPEGPWKQVLRVAYEHLGCDTIVTPQDSGGGGTGGNPPEPPK